MTLNRRIRARQVLLAGIALCLSPAAHADNVAPRHPLTLDNLLGLVTVRGLACSADGKAAVWVATSNDVTADKRVSRLWLADLAGGAPRALTSADANAGSPAFSPDGTMIAFMGKRGKDEDDQIYLLDRRGGEAERLTEAKGNIEAFRWSPDGTRMVVAMTDPEPKGPADDLKRPAPLVIDQIQIKQDMVGFLTATSHTHLFLIDVATRKVTQLTAPTPWDEGEMAWSPDGQSIAYIASHRTDPAGPSRQWLTVISARPGATARVIARIPDTPAQALVWSADGKQLVHAVGFADQVTSDYSQPQLVQTDVESGVTRILPATAGMMIESPVALGQGKIGGTLIEDRHALAVVIDPAGGPIQRLGDPAQTVSEQCGAADGGKGPRAVISSSDGDPDEIRVMTPTRTTRLSAHNTAIASTVNWSVPQDFTARADDGNDVHGMLIRPAGYQPGTRYPLVVWIHGGPTSQDAHSIDTMRQFLAAQGYAVLAVNYRGSTGRGYDYSSTIAADWGNKELRDLDAAIQWAVTSGVADPDRLAVGGWSYGGILTDFLIAREPRLKAAVSGAGEGNIFALFGVDQYIRQYWQEIGPPWKNPDRWIKLSEPLLHADRIKTPTLFMGGTADDNVPLIGGQQMYEALKLTGVPTQLIAYPGANHGLTRPSYVRDRMERIAAWYARYLKPGAAAN